MKKIYPKFEITHEMGGNRNFQPNSFKHKIRCINERIKFNNTDNGKN